MNSDEPAPPPSAEIRPSYNGINEDFFPSFESEEFMSLDSVHEEITTPLQSIYNPSGLHACFFCTWNFTYIDVHMPACQKVKFDSNEKTNDRLEKSKNLAKYECFQLDFFFVGWQFLYDGQTIIIFFFGRQILANN